MLSTMPAAARSKVWKDLSMVVLAESAHFPENLLSGLGILWHSDQRVDPPPQFRPLGQAVTVSIGTARVRINAIERVAEPLDPGGIRSRHRCDLLAQVDRGRLSKYDRLKRSCFADATNKSACSCGMRRSFSPQIANTGAMIRASRSLYCIMLTGAMAMNALTRSGSPVTSGRAYSPLIEGETTTGFTNLSASSRFPSQVSGDSSADSDFPKPGKSAATAK